jgi:hypothetical protein
MNRIPTAIGIALLASGAIAQPIFSSDQMPMPGGSYQQGSPIRFANDWMMGGCILYDFTAFGPPPGPGGMLHYGGPARGGAHITPAGGGGFDSFFDVFIDISLTHTGQSGPNRFFNTEMLSLQLVSQSDPIRIRMMNSPQPSGSTIITDVGGGNFRIDSFFDVFVELSIDGGQSWVPSVDPLHANGSPEPAGIVALSTGLLIIGYGRIRRRRQ